MIKNSNEKKDLGRKVRFRYMYNVHIHQAKKNNTIDTLNLVYTSRAISFYMNIIFSIVPFSSLSYETVCHEKIEEEYLHILRERWDLRILF